MKTHILCAMRDSSTLTHMLRMLEDEQECTCRVVRSGEAALLSAKKRRPDVLVIDAVLPLMDGLGVIDRLKEFYGERMPRVIGGYMMPFAKEGFERRGVNCLVRVPWEPQQLGEALMQMIEKTRLEVDWTHLSAACDRAGQLLSSMGMKTTLRGYEYLANAAALAWEDESRMDAVGERLYKPVAEHCGTTEQTVERLIRHAVESAMDTVGVLRIYGFFGNTIDPMRGKPTNAEMIGMLVQHMRVTSAD